MTLQMVGVVFEQGCGSKYLLLQHSRQPCLLSTQGKLLLLLHDFATVSGTFSFRHPSLRSSILCHLFGLGLCLWWFAIQDDISRLGVALLVELIHQLLLDFSDGIPSIDGELLFVLLLSFLRSSRGGIGDVKGVLRRAQYLHRRIWFRAHGPTGPFVLLRGVVRLQEVEYHQMLLLLI